MTSNDSNVPCSRPFPTQFDKFKEKRKASNGGFVTSKDLPFIKSKDPKCKLLVKHSMGRFICPAQDLEFMMGCIERDPQGYIRSVEFYSPSLKGTK